MSSTSSSCPPGTPPWKPLFETHLSLLPSPEFVLATVSPAPSSTSPTPYVPRLRYLIYRGMWASLPPNTHNHHPKNPPIYTSDLPTFTTDARMSKVTDLFASSPGHGTAAQATGSGGGGAIEAVFWVKDVMTQWRVTGVAYVVSPTDIEDGISGKDSSSESTGGGGGSSSKGTSKGDGGGSTISKTERSGVRTTKAAITPLMRLNAGMSGRESEWSWGREVGGHFANLSPGMRGSFRNPAPGTPVGGGVDGGESVGEGVKDGGKELRMGQKVTGGLEDDDVARGNFRVVVIVPRVVEQLDLSDAERARRWRFTFVGGDDSHGHGHGHGESHGHGHGQGQGQGHGHGEVVEKGESLGEKNEKGERDTGETGKGEGEGGGKVIGQWRTEELWP